MTQLINNGDYTPAEILAFHLISQHCDVVAITRSVYDNIDSHLHEHYGPGGIRNHLHYDFSFDDHVLEAILEEVEGVEDT